MRTKFSAAENNNSLNTLGRSFTRNRMPALRSSIGVGSSSSPRSGALRRIKHSSAAAPAKLTMVMIIMRRMPNMAYSTPPRKLGSRELNC